jgi:hypothetical protein
VEAFKNFLALNRKNEKEMKGDFADPICQACPNKVIDKCIILNGNE